MNNAPRVLAVLKLNSHIADLLTRGRFIVQATTGNPSFPAAQPLLDALTIALDALDAAEVTARGRAQGAVAARDVCRSAALAKLQELKAHVQQIADQAGAGAGAVIEGAGMSVKRSGGSRRSRFAVKPGAVSGSVILMGEALRGRGSYQWQWSTDQKVWTTLPSTVRARTTLDGLNPATVYAFRYRAVTKRGEDDWSQVLTLLVQ